MHPRTLLEAVHGLADCPPAVGVHVVALDRATFVPYPELFRHACAVAHALRRRGVEEGDRVVVAMPSSAELLAVISGVVLAGGVVVCLSPGLLQRNLAAHADGLAAVIRAAGARVSIAQGPVLRALGRLLPPEALWNPQDEPPPRDAGIPAVARGPANLAVIQCTSGTTGRQKGTMITHGNVMNSAVNFWRKIAVTSRDVMVSWLPLFHDMGLNVFFASLAYPGSLVLIPTQLFMYRPELWLQAVSHFRGTLSAAPNFAYQRCVAVPGSRLTGVDLASWRLAFNGAERVTVDTLEAFARRFGPLGFRRDALCPVYGLAEATLAATTSAPGKPYLVDPAPPTEPGAALRPCVGVGAPFADHELVIADEDDRPLPSRTVGQILLRGPSVCRGYFGDPAASAALLRNGYLHTGDLGYLDGGTLFVVGRFAGRIIIRGKTYHAEDIEEVVEALPELRPGGSVAFEVAAGATEALVVAAEVQHPGLLAQAATVEARVRAVLARHFDLIPDGVEILAPNTLGRTSSGKKRRTEFRQSYLARRAAR